MSFVPAFVRRPSSFAAAALVASASPPTHPSPAFAHNGYYVVSEAPKTGFIMTIVDNATPQYKVNDAADFSTWTETVEVEPGDVVTWKYVPAAGYKAISGDNGSETIADADVTVGTAVVLKHVGQGTQADPYLIADANDLKWVADFVNEPNDTTGVYFQQTADIDMTGEDTFPSIGVYKQNGGSEKAFKGTYDGGNFAIKNIKIASGKYAGIFQQVEGGTIQNLVVENVTIDATLDYTAKDATNAALKNEVGGAMVVGGIAGGTIKNVTTKGTFGTEAAPLTASAGGIVCRISSSQSTLIEACTNEASMYTAAAKAAGIVVIMQSPGTAVLRNCANSGSINYIDKGIVDNAGGYAGIIAHTIAITIENCVNSGAINIATQEGKLKTNGGQIIGHVCAASGFSVTGCKGTTTQVAYGSMDNKPITTLDFAEVDGGVATYVVPAAGGSYLVTSELAAFELAGADETIELDETLATATVTVAAALADEYEVDHQGNVYSLKKKGGWNPGADPSVPATNVPGLPESLKVVSLKQISVWAQGAGAAGGDEVKPEDVIVEAFLLNCANNPSVVAAEKAKFKFTEFDPANPPTAEAFASKGYNGTVQVKSFSDAACTTEASTGDQLFYRAFLVPTPAPVKQ